MTLKLKSGYDRRTKTWKRDAGWIEVPVKYGMYEFGTFIHQPSGIIGTCGGNAFLVKVEDEEE